MSKLDDVIDKAKKALLDELYASAIYKKLAMQHRKGELFKKFKTLADVERKHARFWMEFLMKGE